MTPWLKMASQMSPSLLPDTFQDFSKSGMTSFNVQLRFSLPDFNRSDFLLAPFEFTTADVQLSSGQFCPLTWHFQKIEKLLWLFDLSSSIARISGKLSNFPMH